LLSFFKFEGGGGKCSIRADKKNSQVRKKFDKKQQMEYMPLHRFRQPQEIDIHTPAGEQVVMVITESWLSYYGITQLKAGEGVIRDIVLMVDTFGSLMGSQKGYGEGVTCIATELLEKVVGEFVLAWGIAHDDKNALAALKKLCRSIVESPSVSRIEDLDGTWLVNEGVRKVQDVIRGEFYQFVEPPVIVAELAKVCIYELVDDSLKGADKKPPVEIQQLLEDRFEEYQALQRSYQRLRIIEDRVWHLLNVPTYCGCIKRAFLALRVKQLVRLALCYYNNERVPDIDILEALCDVGEQTTRRGTKVRQTNIDRDIHYLRNVLSDRLAYEFAKAIDGVISNSQSSGTGMTFHPMLRPYTKDAGGNSLRADLNELHALCCRDIGMKNLLSDEITQMCRILEVGYQRKS